MPEPESPPSPVTAALAADAAPQPGRGWLVALLVVFALATWFGVRHGIGTSWRECDTQAIARNFVLDGFDPLRPRVDWRGSTDGAVECEFPAYQLLVGAVLSVIGDVEWPGRAWSALSILVAMLALHRLLERSCGPVGALAGLLAFASSGSAALLATRVMPDAMSLAAGLVSLLPFTRFLANGSSVALVGAVLCLALGGLTKPLTLQIGLLWFGWAMVEAPQRLREVRTWLAFGAVVAVVAAWLWHGHALQAETGLTFGVLGAGDAKTPDLRHLFDLATWRGMAVAALGYGISPFGVVALLVLLVRRRFDRADAVWLVAILAGLLVSFRYSHDIGLGPHYHMHAAALGGWLVARAWPTRPRAVWWALLLVAVGAQGLWHLKDERGVRNVVIEHAFVEAAAVVAANSAPGEAILVRCDKPAVDPDWQRPNNFEDPRVLYQAKRRGHVWAADGGSADALRELRGRGVRIVVDHASEDVWPFTPWLREHGDLLFDQPRVRVWRLW